jgi:hypothetical protein
LTCRGFIEKGANDPEAVALQKRLIGWLQRIGLYDLMEPLEDKIINAPLGTLPRETADRTTWTAEGLAVLAWALGHGDLPKHDAQVDLYALTDSLAFLNDSAGDLIAGATLLGQHELRAYRELLYAVHCRLRDFLRNHQKEDFTTWIEQEWLDLLKLSRAQLIAGGDLAIDGKPISGAEGNRVRTTEWAVCEQHRGIIWLIGEYTIYSKTPVDT